tara:strand:+ start:3461 stop:3970 length:510 start_codon:yes stop_codon:yes gene_type:complete
MKVKEIYTGIGGGDQWPTMLIIHSMAEKIKLDKNLKLKNGKVIYKGIYEAHEWLQLLGLSCHFLLYPDGSFVKQRSTKKVCWHARGFNAHSVGIEVLLKGTWNYEEFIEEIKTDWVTDVQYRELVKMSKGIIKFFKIDKVKRHSDLSPERKKDPGIGFKWDWYIKQISV